MNTTIIFPTSRPTFPACFPSSRPTAWSVGQEGLIDLRQRVLPARRHHRQLVRRMSRDWANVVDFEGESDDESLYAACEGICRRARGRNQLG